MKVTGQNSIVPQKTGVTFCNHFHLKLFSSLLITQSTLMAQQLQYKIFSDSTGLSVQCDEPGEYYAK